MLQLTFLGTSAGTPTKQRNVTALAIECLNPYLKGSKQHNKKSRPWVLVDCGEGTQQQLLHTKLSLNQLVVICITHVHGDHCYGLPGLLASAAMSGRQAPLTIIAPRAIKTLLDAVKQTTDLYLPYVVNFVATEEVLSNIGEGENQSNRVVVDLSSDQFIQQQQLIIEVTALSHRVPSHAYGITQTISHSVLDTAKLAADGIVPSAIWGKLQNGEDVYTDQGQQLRSADYVNQKVLYTRIVIAGDNDTPELLKSALVKTDLLVHEATYTNEVLIKIKAKNENTDFDPMHSSAAQIAQFAQDNHLSDLILTHFSARYQNFDNPDSTTANMSHIRQDAECIYTGNLWLAEDFAQYLVNPASDERVQYLGSARADAITHNQ